MGKPHNSRITSTPQITSFTSDVDVAGQLDRRDAALLANRRKFRQTTLQTKSNLFEKTAYAIISFLIAGILFLMTTPD